MKAIKTSEAIDVLLDRLKDIPDDQLTTLYGFVVTEWKRRKRLEMDGFTDALFRTAKK